MGQLRVFLSHSSHDRAIAEALVRALRGAGADVWYDEQNLGTGQLLGEIQRELHDRSVFVVLVSKAAFASPWVRDECTWSFNLYRREPDRIILPITVQPIEQSDFNAWLFLEGFRRLEAPGFQPYSRALAIRHTLRQLALTPEGETRGQITPQPTESMDELMARGKALLAQRMYDQAVPFFERATTMTPSDPEAWTNLAMNLNTLGKSRDALAASERALALAPKYASAWCRKGAALTGLRRYEEGLAACEKAIELEPDSAWAWNNSSVALRGLRKYQEALSVVEKALSFDPRMAEAWYNKGFALMRLKRYEESVQAYDRALAIHSRDDNTWSEKGFSLRCLRRFTEAISAYDLALAINPSNRYAKWGKAVSERALARSAKSATTPNSGSKPS